jgi:hypothetical protein
MSRSVSCGFIRMPIALSPGKLLLVAANTVQLFSVTAVTLAAGLTMVMAGTKKKMLRWKNAHQRCPMCGRSDRHNCACRR